MKILEMVQHNRLFCQNTVNRKCEKSKLEAFYNGRFSSINSLLRTYAALGLLIMTTCLTRRSEIKLRVNISVVILQKPRVSTSFDGRRVKKVNVWFYIAQYPVHWSAQSALHCPLADLFIPAPTRLLREAF